MSLTFTDKKQVQSKTFSETQINLKRIKCIPVKMNNRLYFFKTDDLVKKKIFYYILKKDNYKKYLKKYIGLKNSYIGRYQNIVVTSLSFWVAVSFAS